MHAITDCDEIKKAIKNEMFSKIIDFIKRVFMKLLNKLRNFNKSDSKLTYASPVAAKLINNGKLKSSSQIEKSLQLVAGDIESGRYKILLYRFLTDNIPAVNASVWTWVRLAASEGYYIIDSDNSKDNDGLINKLDEMSENLSVNFTGNGSGKASFISDLYEFLFRDGFFRWIFNC